MKRKYNEEVNLNTLNQFLVSVRKYERGGRKKSLYNKIIKAQKVAKELANKKLFTGKKEESLKKIVRVNIKRPKTQQNN